MKRENKSLNGSFETEIDRLEGHESNLESVGVPLDEKDNNRRSNQDNSNLEHEHDPFESVNANMSGTKPMTKESKPSAEADAETREKIKIMVDKNPSLAHLIDGLGLDLV